MFEELLVIILLLAIFFVVFYIIYNNSCGCNKSLIENFKDGSTNPIFSNSIEQINEINGNISRINDRIDSLEANKESNIDVEILDNIQKVIREFNKFKDDHYYFFNIDDKNKIRPLSDNGQGEDTRKSNK
jgi:predicted PurR-regulated permease PerM